MCRLRMITSVYGHVMWEDRGLQTALSSFRPITSIQSRGGLSARHLLKEYSSLTETAGVVMSLSVYGRLLSS
uniref:Uncharacterized protein n=1 Tax=Steinernema glaseri TaxID=37863 RepID=A0A1I8AFG8_9BILA